MEDHCGKAGRSKVNRLLAKQTRLFSYIEGLQAETPADMECRARNLLQYLYENAVMPSQAADVLADCCTVGQVEVLNAGC